MPAGAYNAQRRKAYYHGGAAGLKIGDTILPPTETGARSLADYGAGGVCSRERVYITTDLAAAVLYAVSVPKGCAYRVRPIGELEPDPDCSELGLSFSCEKAEVLAVIRIKGSTRRRAITALERP